jgi:2,4-dienoyl-CoA reductase-like NADH-dependent reductase (Old Yellow Enzyme family)
MSVLFTPQKIGPVEVKNRFVAPATYECMATETGEVSDQLINRYRALTKGGTGLVIPGVMYINVGKGQIKSQTGIHEDRMISGLKKLTEAVHENGGKIFFEIAQGGADLAPSARKADPMSKVKPREMINEEIEETIDDFGKATGRARDAGADGIHITAAGGSLIDQFLSPFFNKRTDEWGGSDENKYRILRKTIQTCRKEMNGNMALTVKLNTDDYTPKQGITPDLAKKYAGWLAQDGIDGLEPSQGTLAFSPMNVCRGDVPISEILKSMPLWMRPIGWLVLRRMVGKYDVEEGWNLSGANLMKTAIGNTPLFLTGGLRKLITMQKIVEDGKADFISLCRPLIREPNLVNKFKTGQAEVATCTSCNKCLGAALNGVPIRCFCESERPKQ